MLTRRTQDQIDQNNRQMFVISLDTFVPQDHILRKINENFDWSFIYELTEDQYSTKPSRPALDPVIFFKILFLRFIENLGSIRNTLRQANTNLAYRWFLGLSIDEKIPDPSTISKTLSRRYSDTDIFKQIFEHILLVCINNGLVDLDEIFIDSTHVKANANPHKYVSAYVEKEAAYFQEALEEEIKQDRIAHGKKPLKEKKKEEVEKECELIVYEGELKEVDEVDVDLSNYEVKKVSKTDCTSGWFHKGEHKQLFAFGVQAACNKNNYILTYGVDAGNKHDSRTFFNIYEAILSYNPTRSILDAGYKTPPIAKYLIDAQITPHMPYKRPMTKKGFYKKYEYVYDELYDCYICPQNQILDYSITNRDGYREYKSDPKICCDCPDLENCTLSENHTKVLTRHLWADYIDEVEDIRHTLGSKEIYNKRKETIELVFADCKENFGFRFTNYRGIEKMEMVTSLTFASYNLVKLANHINFSKKHKNEEKNE